MLSDERISAFGRNVKLFSKWSRNWGFKIFQIHSVLEGKVAVGTGTENCLDTLMLNKSMKNAFDKQGLLKLRQFYYFFVYKTGIQPVLAN